MLKDPDRYKNLIDNQRPIAGRPMEAIKRAAQFAPFAALTGYDAQIRETARDTDEEIEIDESEKEIIDYRLKYLQEHLAEQPEVVIKYFVADRILHNNSQKSGGSYFTKTGAVKKLDMFQRSISFTDGEKLPLDSIVEIYLSGNDAAN